MKYLKEVLTAESRIRPFIRETPIDRSHHLSELGSAEVYLKSEHLQHTGSFKIRGALNKILSLSRDELERGVIAASNGNHGMAVSFAARQAGVLPTIYMKKRVAQAKVELINSLGGRAVFYGDNPLEAEVHARKVAEQSGQIFISPYNDAEVIAGQGTIGVELQRQLEGIDAVFVAVGGGGLISGISGYLKSVIPSVRIVGCWPENSRVLYESIKAGRVIDFPEDPTISDSTAGGIEMGSITLELCRETIDDCVLVSEAEIVDAMRLVMDKERWIIEGAAGVAVAAYIKERRKYEGKKVVILICGRNISMDRLRSIF
jgi:threonine dehydratase